MSFVHLLSQNIYYTYNHKNNFNFEKPKKELLREIKSPLKIENFINYVDDYIIKVSNNLEYSSNFLLQPNEKFKNLREEYFIINEFIKFRKIDKNKNIYLGKKSENWDAKINYNNENLIIEVTQAIPDNEHLTRIVLAQNMYGLKCFSLNLRQIYQDGLNSFPNKIVEVINKKHEKNYNDNRILIVGILNEFAYDEADIMDYWIEYLEQNTEKRNFKEIWIGFDFLGFYRLH